MFLGFIFLKFKTDPDNDPDLNLFQYTFINGSILKPLK